MTDYTKARINMVDSQIEPAGVTNAAVREAFSTVPREIFVPSELASIAYSDHDIEISTGRYLLSALTHSKLLQAAQPKSSDIVLDVACATGYSSAILSSLVTTVISIESDAALLSRAAKNWKELAACNIASVQGDITSGAAAHGPYDLIIINGAVSAIPDSLVDQLSEKGRLLTILRKSPSSVGHAVLVSKNSNTGYSVKVLFDAHCAYLAEFAPVRAFAL